MVAFPDELLERLGRGEDPERLLALLLSDEDAELVKLAAVPRRLDAGVLGVLLGSQDSAEAARALQRLEALRLTEPVPGSAGALRLRRALREESLQRWWHDGARAERVPVALADVSRDLRDHFASAGEELEAVYHDFAVEPGAAAARFQRLYDEADAIFDLGRCGELLRVIEQAAGHLPPEISQQTSRYAARFGARSLWIDDWYSSSWFLPPQPAPGAGERSCDVLERLLEGGIRTLELRARGGMGKTTHLRWLVARRCAPAEIACSRIDFDEADATAAIESPWLVMLAIAMQLNPQMPGAPFERLVAQYGDQLPRLYPSAGVEAPLPLSVEQDEAIGLDLLRSFDSAVAGMPADQCWVVILDTLEVPLIRVPEATDAQFGFITQLGRLGQAANARLILAGRQAVSERLASFPKVFPQAEILELHGFSLDDRHRYLREKRKVLADDIVEAAAKVAGEVPFKLALVADVIARKPSISASALEEYGDPDLLYLVHKVLERIDERPRWVLRYGAVPRTLDFAFVSEVMKPYLLLAMAGDDGRDPVAAKKLPDGRSAAELLRPDPAAAGDDLDLEVLWSELRRYAGESSWVTIPRRRPDVLQLHADVVRPMRRWLAENEELYSDLQAAACRHFEERLQSDPENAARWAKEAVFHRFQLEGAKAKAYWREQIRAASGPDRAEVRLALATDLTGLDYVDENGPLPWVDNRPLIESETLAAARFEEAWAHIQIARSQRAPRTSRHWREGRLALESAQREFADPRGPRYTNSRMAMVWTAIHFAEGNEALARAEFGKAIWLDHEDRVWFWLEYGPTLASGAIRRFAGRMLAENAGLRASDRSTEWRRWVADAAGIRDAEDDRLSEAVKRYAETLAGADPAEREEASAALAALRLRTGETGTALELLSDARSPGARLLKARVLIKYCRPREALEGLGRGVLDIESVADGGSVESAALEAEAAELRARAMAALIEPERATRAFLQAADCWSRAGNPDGTARAHARRAAFLAHVMGDIRDARVAVGAAERAAAREGSSAWTKVRLARVHVAASVLEHTRVTKELEQTIELLRRAEAPPRRLVKAALAGLAVDAAEAQQKYVELLIEQVRHVTPETARLEMLGRLRHVAPLSAVSRRVMNRLRKALPSVYGDRFEQLTARDRAMLLLADADVDRVIGDREAAVRKLREARAAMVGDRGGAALLEWLEAVARLGGEPDLVSPLWAELVGRLRTEDPAAPATAALAAAFAQALAPQLDAEAEDAITSIEEAAAGRRETVFDAALAEALAGVRRAHGDPAAAEHYEERAARIYDGLGDLAALERLLGAASENRVIAERPDDSAIELTIRAAKAGFDVELSDRAGNVARSSVTAPHLARLLTGAGTAGWSEAYARGLATELLENPDSLAFELWQVLSAAGLEKLAGPRCDVRLRLTDQELEVAPWEIGLMRGARQERARFRWFCRSAAYPLAEPPEERHGPVSPGVSRTVTLVRAHGTVPQSEAYWNASAVERIYASFGFHVQVLAGPEATLDSLSRSQSEVVHLSAPLWETAGSVSLDIGSSHVTRGQADTISPAALASALYEQWASPLVILDPPLPSSRADTIVQLLLRNAFAGELFALGAARAIVGLGLVVLDAQEQVYRTLVGLLADGHSLGETIAAVRAYDSTGAATLHARSAELRPRWTM